MERHLGGASGMRVPTSYEIIFSLPSLFEAIHDSEDSTPVEMASLFDGARRPDFR